MRRPPTPPRATYRVQLHAGFGFDDAAAIVPYLAKLGISHVYCSPYLQARAGSTHGYDVVDHALVNEELGGAEAHGRLLDALEEHGMGHILDIVPNHMAINDAANAWWWDILKHGPHSLFASFFDIDWDPHEDKLRRKILVPILGDHYGRVLEAGEVQFGYADGEPVARYYEQTLPLAPGTEPGDIDSVNRDIEAVHEVLEEQNYRLARWRVASEELNYRRFFAINDLAALRAENPEVFRQTHALVLDLVERGDLQGLRIDHIDGLRRPADYLTELRAAAPHVYIVVEKILEHDEALPDWPVQGTTGYDFLNRVNGLFVDPAGAGALTSVYETFTGDVADRDDQRRAKKLAIANSELASDIERLTDLFAEICERHRRYRDYTRRELRSALIETMAAFPVYRTYVNPASRSVDDTDRRVIERAIETARARREDLEVELFDLLRDVLLLRFVQPAENNLAMRFQQATGAVMAKGVEDTLFYSYNRLTSLNEVGGDPGRLGVSLDDARGVEEFVAPLVLPGRFASLAQTLMKLTAPGVPDIYQGSEVWDLSLVDPDNRRPVDYGARRKLLDSLSESPPNLDDDGVAKMFIVRRALEVRAELPEVFDESSTYDPLEAAGDHVERVVAYVRGERVVVVAPRLTFELPDMKATSLTLPPGVWTDRLAGGSYQGVVALAELWGEFPVSLLAKEDA